MLRRTLLMSTAALALLGAMAAPSFADPVTLRIVSKDMLTTNPDDVKEMVHDVFRHRLILSYEANAAGVSADQAIDRLVERVAVA